MKITIGMLLYLLSLNTAIYTNISRQAEYTIDGFEIWDGEFPKKNMLYLITQEDLKKIPICGTGERCFHSVYHLWSEGIHLPWCDRGYNGCGGAL